MNPEKIQQVIQTYLQNRLGSEVDIHHFSFLTGGACQKNYLLDLTVHQGEEKGKYEVVFRTSGDGGKLLFGLDRDSEFEVTQLAFQRNVLTPQARWFESDTSYLGVPFYFMQRIQGNADGRYLAKDKTLNNVREDIIEDLAKNLAIIHSIHYDQESIPAKLKQALLCKPDITYGNVTFRIIAYLREVIGQRKNEAHPGIEMLLNWLEANIPPTNRLVLVHGDYRAGNFMVSPEKLNGILDWEFAHWGDRHEDVGWISVKDWRFGKINLEVAGLASLDNFIEKYNFYSDEPLDKTTVLYWQIFGNVRWAISCLEQADRYLNGIEKSIDLLAIGRRTFEMQYEAIKLIESR